MSRLDALVGGHAHDPHAVLGAHPHDGRTVIRALCRGAADVQWGNVVLNMPALGLDWHERFDVRDELTGVTYDWGQYNAVRLDPYLQPAHIFSVHPHAAQPKAEARPRTREDAWTS